MDGLEADLRAYYDQEAAERAGRDVEAARVEVRDRFADQLRAEGRRHLLEVGVGPGRDATAFAAAGLAVTGIDLSSAHARLTGEAGIAAAQASLYALPFRPDRFDAGWTMSTLVHVPDARFDEAMTALTAALRPGAPLAVGLWGGLDQEGPSPFDRLSPPRFFSLRSHDRAREMLGRHGDVERFDTWARPGIEWEYQVAVLRVR